MSVPFIKQSSTQIGKNLQGKEFRGHSAFEKFRKKMEEHLNVKSLGTDQLKRFVKENFKQGGRYGSGESAVKFLRDKLKLDGNQRDKIISEFTPSNQKSPHQLRAEARIKKVMGKDQTAMVIKSHNSGLAKSQLHTSVSAIKPINVEKKFGSFGQRDEQKHADFAGGNQPAPRGLTGDSQGVVGGQSQETNQPPSHLQF